MVQSERLGSNLPSDLIPVTVQAGYNSTFKIRSHGQIQVVENRESYTIEDELENLPFSLSWAVDEWHGRIREVLGVAQAISNGTALAATDGSYKQERCTGSFILTNNLDSRCFGVNQPPGTSSDASPYRGELSAICGILTVLRCFWKVHNLKSGKVVIAIDCLEALKKAMSKKALHPSMKCFDLLQVVRQLCAEIPFEIEWRKVKAHQDHIPVSQLDMDARLNRFVDLHAKAYWNRCHATNYWIGSRELYGEKVSIFLGGTKQTSVSTESLYDWVSCVEVGSIEEYWADKHNMSLETGVAWDAVQRAHGSLPVFKKRWLTKFMTGFLSTGQREFWRGNSLAPRCPRCSYECENTLHMLECRGSGAKQVWLSFLAGLDQWLWEQRTDPEIITVLLTRLADWNTGRAMSFSFVPSRVLNATRCQDAIGWNNFLLGRMSDHWGVAQQRYYDMSGSRRSGNKWQAGLVLQVWSFLWETWLHRLRIVHHTLHPLRFESLTTLRLGIRRIWNHCSQFSPDTLAQLPSVAYLSQWLETHCRQWLGIAQKRGVDLLEFGISL